MGSTESEKPTRVEAVLMVITFVLLAVALASKARLGGFYLGIWGTALMVVAGVVLAVTFAMLGRRRSRAEGATSDQTRSPASGGVPLRSATAKSVSRYFALRVVLTLGAVAVLVYAMQTGADTRPLLIGLVVVGTVAFLAVAIRDVRSSRRSSGSE